VSDKRRVTVEIPTRIERAIATSVAHHLETELGGRGLLLAVDAALAAAAEATQRGARLLTCAIHRCYPITRQAGSALAVEFESERDAARLEAALAFGAATARVLMPYEPGVGPQSADSVELLCAVFNLGIGLVDGLCDEDAGAGGALLELVQQQDLVGAAELPRRRGWLGATLPTAIARDHTVAFTVDVIEVFFEMLHTVFADDASVRRRRAVGVQLADALEAERQTVIRPGDRSLREQLRECSRRTSVIPFQIIETLAGGEHTPSEPTPGTLLGEAMWRIDDLVDLCQDASSGALNGLVLAAMDEPPHPAGESDPVAALERLLASTHIARAAAQAAESLLAGLQLASSGRAALQDDLPSRSFLHFIQRYAGIAPRETS
jgi:hypothetical protein